MTKAALRIRSQKNHILVTGGCGFIGSNLLPRLVEKGYRVRVLDNLSVGSMQTLDGLNVELQVGDIRDDCAVREAARGVAGVVHLAAHASVVDSQHDPLHDFEVNARGTLNLLLACRDLGARHLVFASSNAPVGETAPPVDESKPSRPLSPYGASKLAGEGYCSAFYGSYGLPTIALRFSNVYGPRSSHKGSVVARFIRDALELGQLTVYGDGQQTRDLIHVQDLCRAAVRAYESDLGGQTLQIGTGRETCILELAEMVRRQMPDRQIRIVHVPRRPGEIRRNFSCIDEAHRLLGWEPQVALEEGIAETVRWFRAQ